MTAVARRKGRPNLAEGAQIDRLIREAALQVLIERGEAATLNAVAQAAGLSRKSVYARYPNKAGLFIEVIRDLMRDVSPIPRCSEGTAEDRLLHYVEAALDAVATPQSQALQRLLMLEPAYTASLRPEMRQAVHKMFFVPLRELLAAATAQGAFAVEDLEATTGWIVSLILVESIGPTAQAMAASAPAERAIRARRLTRLLTQGLLARPI